MCIRDRTLPPRRDLSSVRAFQIAANIFGTMELSATTIHTFIILRQWFRVKIARKKVAVLQYIGQTKKKWESRICFKHSSLFPYSPSSSRSRIDMWRNFRFLYKANGEKSDKCSGISDFFTWQMWRIVKSWQLWRNLLFLHMTDVKNWNLPCFVAKSVD